MILQELVKYYERMSAVSDNELAPIGLEWKEVSFAVVINDSGDFQQLEDLRTGDKKPRGRRCLVPQGIKRASNIAAQPLWDKLSYVLGCEQETDEKEKGKKEEKKKKNRAPEEHEAFKVRVVELSALTNDSGVAAVKKFLDSFDLEQLKQDMLWQEFASSTGFISFRVLGRQELVCESKLVHQAFTDPATGEGEAVTCLVTGKSDELARLHAAIKGVYNAQSSGASIVSFNQDSFRSYGKEQGANAPVGKYAATAYTTALNSLLERQSKQRLLLGETSVVFWSEKRHIFEDVLFNLFGEEQAENPQAHVEAVKSLYKAPHTGVLPFDDDPTQFFVLGLGPNAARLSIRFWHASTVQEMAANIRQYFDDVKMIAPEWLKDKSPTLMDLLLSTALRNERKNLQPSLPGSVLKAILAGTPFPCSLASALLRRIRSEHGDKPGAEITKFFYRASLLKAYLNRDDRQRKQEENIMSVELDEQNTNIGYSLGRLFAVLEKIQADALGDINASIRDRFYAAASATPVTCFPQLMRLKNHHLAKLSDKGHVIYHEKQLAKIISGIKDFPSHLSMADQGRFAIGYYHQRQHFYTGKQHSTQEHA